MKGEDINMHDVKNRNPINDVSADSENEPTNLVLYPSFPIGSFLCFPNTL